VFVATLDCSHAPMDLRIPQADPLEHLANILRLATLGAPSAIAEEAVHEVVAMHPSGKVIPLSVVAKLPRHALQVHYAHRESAKVRHLGLLVFVRQQPCAGSPTATLACSAELGPHLILGHEVVHRLAGRTHVPVTFAAGRFGPLTGNVLP